MNTITKFRSNLFRVKDQAQFHEWCEDRNLRMFTDDDHPDLVGFKDSTIDGQEVIMVGYDENPQTGETERREIDIVKEVAPFLADGYVAIVMEITYEGYRFIDANGYAINNKGRREDINLLGSITVKAKTLGRYVTACQDEQFDPLVEEEE